MSRVQGKDSDLSSELPFSNLKDRCETCRNISTCNVCGISISGFEHIGVRATSGQESGIWHYASPCRHRNQLRATAANVKYGGGPLWKSRSEERRGGKKWRARREAERVQKNIERRE